MKTIRKMRKYLFLCLTAVLVSCSEKPVEWVVSTPDVFWKTQTGNVQYVKTASPDAVIDLSNPLQTIDGFGVCFNELGWTSLSALNDADREAIMKELFEPRTGANFTICRMPVGANDFSRDWYSYNEEEGDFEMKHFSIKNDFETLIPFIKNAQKYHPGLKIWASPWSPPMWMKYNKHYACAVSYEGLDEAFQNGLTADKQGAEGTNMFIQQDKYFAAYALYFSKFIEAYRQEGIAVFAVMPQNEFNSCQIFPSCTWTSAGLNTFVGQYLGPAMEQLNVDMFFGTMERENPLLVDTLLQDPASSRYIKGLGFQWAGKKSVAELHERYPGLKIYQTEQECGDGLNDWKYCCYAWELMKLYLNAGANAYMYWNTSLAKGGISRWGWAQNSLVTVDTEAKTYTYNYEYYLLKHFSHYVLPGAQMLSISGEFTDLLAFKNPDKSIVLVIYNEKDEKIQPNIKVGNQIIAPELMPRSFNTVKLVLD
jgi:glucosylceramidase